MRSGRRDEVGGWGGWRGWSWARWRRGRRCANFDMGLVSLAFLRARPPLRSAALKMKRAGVPTNEECRARQPSYFLNMSRVNLSVLISRWPAGLEAHTRRPHALGTQRAHGQNPTQVSHGPWTSHTHRTHIAHTGPLASRARKLVRSIARGRLCVAEKEARGQGPRPTGGAARPMGWARGGELAVLV